MMRKWMLLAALLVMLLTLPAERAQATCENEEGVGFVQQTEYESSLEDQASVLGIDIQKLKAVLSQGLYQCDAKIDISTLNIAYTQENVNLISNLIHDEMPESFHVNGFSYGYSAGKLVRITPNYTIGKTQYQQMCAQLQLAVDQLLVGIADNSRLTDVQKALLIHDRLALVCEYDYNNGTYRHNMYGALVMGAAVCQGYAEAYDYLLEKVGIEGYICESMALYHAWNIIYIDGKAYHVDVTWDDYAWATGERGVEGAVKHDNFLRSSAGIYSTEHDANDYDTTPNDTTYDACFWQNVKAAFLLVGDEIYYIDGADNQLKRYSDQAALCSVEDRWMASATSYWRGNFSRLATDGKVLFYSLTNKVYQYDPATGAETLIFAPELDKDLEIYGLSYQDGYLICDINDNPPYSSGKRPFQLKESYQSGPAVDPNLTFVQNPSLSFQDYIGMQVLIYTYLADSYDEIYVEAIQVDPTAGAITTKLEGILYYDYFYLFDQQILSWAMAENVTLTLYGVKDGVTFKGQSFSGSVESMAMGMLEEGTDAVISKILVDMLNYGAAVQTAFDHNADCLPNTNLAPYAHLGTQDVPATEVDSEPTGSGIEAYSVSLSMQAKVEFQLLFLQDISAYTVKATLNGEDVPVIVDNETIPGYPIVSIAASAANMRDTYELALYDANGNVVSVNYHLNVEASAKGLVGGEYNDVVVAMMRYGDAVKAYAG